MRDMSIAAIRRRSKTWEIARKKLEQQLERDGHDIFEPESSQPARDRAALLRMMDAGPGPMASSARDREPIAQLARHLQETTK